MKIISYLLCVIFVLIMFKASYAFQNEPVDFRGIKWGSKAEEYQDLEIVKYRQNTNDYKVYERKNDKRKIGDVKIGFIEYKFYKNRFYEAIVDYDWDDRDALEKTLTAIYGKGKSEYIGDSRSAERAGKACDNYNWLGKNVDIKIIKETTSYAYPVTPESIVFSSYISFTYKPISKQKERDDKIKYDQEYKIKTSKEKEEKRKREQEMRKKVEKDL
ncbi:MAG: hypothetical protein HY753_09185 [Nitrospirae bacterium]|nr:hypothetical protein [Nitrospirota bacterium]